MILIAVTCEDNYLTMGGRPFHVDPDVVAAARHEAAGLVAAAIAEARERVEFDRDELAHTITRLSSDLAAAREALDEANAKLAHPLSGGTT